MYAHLADAAIRQAANETDDGYDVGYGAELSAARHRGFEFLAFGSGGRRFIQLS